MALMANGSDRCKSYAKWALTELPVPEYAQGMQSGKPSHPRRLDRYDGTGKIDMRLSKINMK